MTDLQGRLLITAARWKLGNASPEELVAEAISLLNVGADSTALRRLAGLVGREVNEASSLFRQVLTDLEVADLTKREAALVVARQIAEDIVNKSIPAHEGAQRIWTDIAVRIPEAETELIEFVALASEWEDASSHRAEYERDIIEHAARFLRSTDVA